MSIEAMKQALNALEECRRDPRLKYEHSFYDKTITALRTAIAEAEKQEPVADGLIRGYVNALVANKPDEAADATKRMVDYVFATPPAAQPAVPDFNAFMAWANDAGYDIAHTHDGIKWLCLNPMTADLWKAWQAAHGITEEKNT